MFIGGGGKGMVLLSGKPNEFFEPKYITQDRALKLEHKLQINWLNNP